MISIVTAYYNRKKLFRETLKSINKSAYTDFEVIAVDDASSDEERIEDLITEFPFLKVIRIEKVNKRHYNSCVPFNIGIKAVSGNIVMLQNPECLHVHDILSYVVKKVNDFNYVTISAYQTGKELTPRIVKLIENRLVSSKYFLDFFAALPQQRCGINAIGWYNHSIYQPTAYHFCSAMTRKNMNRFRGFAQKFALGIGFEDAEFIDRVRASELEVIISDEVSVIHQWHPSSFEAGTEQTRLYRRNSTIYNRKLKL